MLLVIMILTQEHRLMETLILITKKYLMIIKLIMIVPLAIVTLKCEDINS